MMFMWLQYLVKIKEEQNGNAKYALLTNFAFNPKVLGD
jgi:hypothetical protein